MKNFFSENLCITEFHPSIIQTSNENIEEFHNAQQ